MNIADDGNHTNREPEPEIITVQVDSVFHGFTVTEVREDFVRFVSNWGRYIVNNGSVEKEFAVHKNERIRLNLIDILDATDITVVELLDVTTSNQ